MALMYTPLIVFLLDISGSMYGDKIELLRLVFENIVDNIKNTKIEPEPRVSVITFGREVTCHFTDEPISKARLGVLEAGGTSPLEAAVAEGIAGIDRQAAVVLVSDGAPDNGAYQRHLRRSEMPVSCYAVAVGYDADTDMLLKFAQNQNNLFMPSEMDNIGTKIIYDLLEAAHHG